MTTQQGVPPPLPLDEAPPRPKREIAVETFIRIAGMSTIVLIILIFVFLLKEGIPAFFHVSLSPVFPLSSWGSWAG